MFITIHQNVIMIRSLIWYLDCFEILNLIDIKYVHIAL